MAEGSTMACFELVLQACLGVLLSGSLSGGVHLAAAFGSRVSSWGGFFWPFSPAWAEEAGSLPCTGGLTSSCYAVGWVSWRGHLGHAALALLPATCNSLDCVPRP